MKKIIIILGLFNITNSMENQKTQCTVIFKPSESGLSQVTRNILEEIPNPNIVVWYSGEDGLTVRSKDFYEKNLIVPLKQVNISPQSRKTFQLCLYDLGAWNILKKDRQSERAAPLEVIIKNQKYCNTKPVSSEDFFQWLSNLKKQHVNTICDVLKHSFIWRISSEYCDKQIKLNRNPSYNKTLSEVIDIKDYPNEFQKYFIAKDNAYIYSALQYLEAFFITQKLSQSKSSDPCNIVFLLPGDEYTYYTDKTDISCTALQEDLNLFFTAFSYDAPQRISIYFYGFRYLHNGCQRPYLKINDDKLYLTQ